VDGAIHKNMGHHLPFNFALQPNNSVVRLAIGSLPTRVRLAVSHGARAKDTFSKKDPLSSGVGLGEKTPAQKNVQKDSGVNLFKAPFRFNSSLLNISDLFFFLYSTCKVSGYCLVKEYKLLYPTFHF
jgi:hypothetical protein